MHYPTTISINHLSDLSDQRVAVTGIGLMTSLGTTREASWKGIREGKSGVVWLDEMIGLPAKYTVGAPVVLEDEEEVKRSGKLKSIVMAERSTDEALADADLDLSQIDPFRVGCAIAGHMGDERGILKHVLGMDLPDTPIPWQDQVFPDSATRFVANRLGIAGPRLSHSTACASGLISTLSAVRCIRAGRCDVAIAGGSEVIDPLFAAGFHNMRALARHDDPTQACRPFDRNRTGFVMGEGSAIFVLERLSHALARNARIYCTLNAGRILSEAHHMTGLDMDNEALKHLIRLTLAQANVDATDIAYVNAHGTGTEQNDRAEMQGIADAFRVNLPDLLVSATKSMIGHLVNAAGSVELATTILSLRDEFVPPTLNLTDPDPECQFDCVPLVGRRRTIDHALKLSLAFGGHLVGVVASRWQEQSSGLGPNEIRRAA